MTESPTCRWLDIKPRITVSVALVVAASDALCTSAHSWAAGAGAPAAPFIAAFLLAGALFSAFLIGGRLKLGAFLALICVCMSAWTVWRSSPLPADSAAGNGTGIVSHWQGVIEELQIANRSLARLRLRLSPAPDASSRIAALPGVGHPYDTNVRRTGNARIAPWERRLPAGCVDPDASSRMAALPGVGISNGSGGREPASKATLNVQTELPVAWLPTKLTAAWQRGEHPLVELRGWLRKPHRARFPWDFDQAGYLERQQVVAILKVCKGTLMFTGATEPASNPTDAMALWADTVRERMVSLHRRCLGDERGDLLSSMVIGDRAVRPSEEIRLQFRMLGLSHIVAASGFNLTIVVMVAWWAMRFFVRSRLLVNLWCFGAIVMFSLLAGLSASVERAALMCTVMLVVTACRRCVHLPASISLALTVTLFIQPAALFDAGLQLSYAATFAIACCVNRINRLLGERALRPRWLLESAVVVVVANLAVLPLQMIYFWQIGALSVVANMLVSPLVAPVTVLGFIASALAGTGLPAATALSSLVDWLAGWPLDLMMLIVRWLSSYRWSLINVGPPLPAFTCAYYLALCGMFACLPSPGALRRRWLLFSAALAVFVLSSLLLFLRPSLSAPTIIMFPTAQLLVMPEGQGLIAGDAQNRSLRRAVIFLRVKESVQIPCLLPLIVPTLRRQWANSTVFQVRDGRPVFVSDGEHLFSTDYCASFSSSTL